MQNKGVLVNAESLKVKHKGICNTHSHVISTANF